MDISLVLIVIECDSNPRYTDILVLTRPYEHEPKTKQEKRDRESAVFKNFLRFGAAPSSEARVPYIYYLSSLPPASSILHPSVTIPRLYYHIDDILGL